MLRLVSTIKAKTDTYNLEPKKKTFAKMVPVNPGLFLKITGTGIIITKKGPGLGPGSRSVTTGSILPACLCLPANSFLTVTGNLHLMGSVGWLLAFAMLISDLGTLKRYISEAYESPVAKNLCVQRYEV